MGLEERVRLLCALSSLEEESRIASFVLRSCFSVLLISRINCSRGYVCKWEKVGRSIDVPRAPIKNMGRRDWLVAVGATRFVGSTETRRSALTTTRVTKEKPREERQHAPVNVSSLATFFMPASRQARGSLEAEGGGGGGGRLRERCESLFKERFIFVLDATTVNLDLLTSAMIRTINSARCSCAPNSCYSSPSFPSLLSAVILKRAYVYSHEHTL